MRTTNDKKDYNLRIRLNDKMYSHLSEMSGKQGKSFSGYVRDLIERDIAEKAINIVPDKTSDREIKNDNSDSSNTKCAANSEYTNNVHGSIDSK